MEIELTEREFMYPGHVGCPGCGAAIAMRFVLKALGEKMIMVMPACCWSVIAGPYPTSTLKIPVIHSAFETGGATASGVRAALDMKGDTETTVVTWAGDGGTFDIGFQALSGAVERNEDFIYVCYDNEAYMNTGIQRSSSTPYGAWTTTTPGKDWKKMRKKNIVEALVAHRIPYAATASISYPEDLIRKVRKAKPSRAPGFSTSLRAARRAGGSPRRWPSRSPAWPSRQTSSPSTRWRTACVTRSTSSPSGSPSGSTSRSRAASSTSRTRTWT